jgi:hypothetical protein
MYIKIGDKDVEYNKNFRLFLHTKLSKPHYPPEIQAETTLITFAVTEQVCGPRVWGANTAPACAAARRTPAAAPALARAQALHHSDCRLGAALVAHTLTQGLEDQLLALVVNKERPDLEETKTQLIIQSTEFTIKLKQLEDELLYKLSTAEGDITGPLVWLVCVAVPSGAPLSRAHAWQRARPRRVPSTVPACAARVPQRTCRSSSRWRPPSAWPQRSGRRCWRRQRRRLPSTTAATCTGQWRSGAPCSSSCSTA